MVPNEIIDEHLSELTGAEIKILLAISRKTIGWHKDTDWICNQQMMDITGLSKKTVIMTISSLIFKGLIVQDRKGGKGKEKLYYELSFEEGCKKVTGGVVKSTPGECNNVTHKINTTKDTIQKKKDIVPQQVLNYFNKTTGKHFTTINKYIYGRINDGFTLDDAQKVIMFKWLEWKDDDKMKMYIRPSTLFGPAHFEEYLMDANEGLGRMQHDAYREWMEGFCEDAEELLNDDERMALHVPTQKEWENGEAKDIQRILSHSS